MSKVGFNCIKGSVNLITGCGSGLGKATLERFVSQGSGPILAIDRQFPENFLENLNFSDREKGLLTIRNHNTFDSKVEASISKFVAQNGAFDNVINVAGVALAFALWTNSEKVYDLKHAHDLMEFNTVGTFNMIRLASKFMIQESLKSNQDAKNRCIINTSCLSTTLPTIGQSFLAASKAALDSMTLCLAREFSPFNIRCNTINVGYFDTKLLRASEKNVANYLAHEVSLCPKKLGHPLDFAHLVEKIVENQMINGSCIKLHAGATYAM